MHFKGLKWNQLVVQICPTFPRCGGGYDLIRTGLTGKSRSLTCPPTVITIASLPQELTESIIDALPAHCSLSLVIDHTLSNCSLVCRAFTQRCQERIFRWLIVTEPRGGDPRRAHQAIRLSEVEDLLNDVSHLLQHVHLITMSHPTPSNHHNPPAAGFARLLQASINLVCLELLGSSLFDEECWTVQFLRFSSRLPSLQRLHIASFHPIKCSVLSRVLQHFSSLHCVNLPNMKLWGDFPNYPINQGTHGDNSAIRDMLIRTRQLWEYKEISLQLRKDGVHSVCLQQQNNLVLCGVYHNLVVTKVSKSDVVIIAAVS